MKFFPRGKKVSVYAVRKFFTFILPSSVHKTAKFVSQVESARLLIRSSLVCLVIFVGGDSSSAHSKQSPFMRRFPFLRSVGKFCLLALVREKLCFMFVQGGCVDRRVQYMLQRGD